MTKSSDFLYFFPKDLDVSGFIPNFALLIPGSLCFFKLSGLFFLQIHSCIYPSARKVIRDKHLYIIKDVKTYSLDGKRVK